MASSFPSLSQPASGFPLPTVSEDTLFYNIHIPSTEDAAATALLVSDFVSSLLPTPWLWNKDAWELKVPQDDGVGRARGALKDQHKLSGTMRVGDAVDDEWLIVWLLREVSRKWPEFVISIRDTDGEFLLIEAANELPSWVSPDNAENRLWLSAGQLHLIPLSVRSSKGSVRFVPDDETLERQYDPDAQLSEEDAIAAVRTERYQASRDVQSAVWDRIAHYPSKMSDHLHHTKAYLPLPVARALSQNPSLIQKAVEGFYVRDPAQLRGAARMTHFPPSTAILAPVLLTRAAYAQLQGQVFHPPRVFGPEWHVTAAQEGKTDEQLERERRWRDIGVKIATGFEIMYKEGGKSKRGDASSSGDIPRDDPEWQAYMSKLKSAGFFGDELEGSQKWQERQAKALHGWQDITRSSDTAQFRPSFALLVEEALAKALENASELSAKPTDTEDSDSWLEVSPDDLDAILLKASGTDNQPDTSPKNAAAEAASADGMEAEHPLKELAQKVQAFVGGQGDLQGARFEDEFSDDDDVNDSDDEDGTQTRPRDEDDDEEVPADPWDRMTPAEKEARMSNLVSALPIEEWGRKPDPPKAKAIPATENTKVDQSSSTSPSKAKAASMFKQDFDGVESDSESEDDEDAELPAAGTLGRKIAQMRWADGAPQIEEINEDEDVDMDAAAGGEEDEEDRLDRMREKSLRWDDGIDEAMRKRVWGADGAASAGKVKAEDRPVVVNADEAADEGDAGMDVDMEKEMNDFLTFARETLGVGEDQWDGILKSREERGAFVPGATTRTMAAPAPAQAATGSAPKPASTSIITPAPPQASSAPDTEDPGADLDTFEKVMAAMDTQLSSAKRPNAPTPSSSNGETKSKPSSAPLPPLPTEADLEALSQDDLLQMDRELRAALKSAGIDDEDDDDDLMGELDPEEAKALKGEDREEYRMMRDFLESYRSQGGQGGAVGNLLGRLSGAGKGGK